MLGIKNQKGQSRPGLIKAKNRRWKKQWLTIKDGIRSGKLETPCSLRSQPNGENLLKKGNIIYIFIFHVIIFT